MIDQPSLRKEELIELALTFGLYQILPKDKWKYIKEAASDTDESRKAREKLLQDYRKVNKNTSIVQQDSINS